MFLETRDPTRRFRSAILAVPTLVGTGTRADPAWRRDTEQGWTNADRAIPSTPERLLAESDEAFAAERYDEAALGYRLLIDSHPSAEQVPRAYVQLMESRFRSKDYDECLEVIDAILARKPDAETVSLVIRRKYEIGTAYLAGARRRVFGISVSAEDEGISVLDSLVERFPYQPYSDDALYHIGAHFQNREQYLDAEVVYERLIRDYPQSDWASLAEYQIGASALSRLKGVEYDFAPVDEAERRFRRYLRLHPGGDRAEAADRGLTTVSRLRAEKLFGIAQFYQREGKPTAVRTYLQRLLRDHPEAPVADKARDLLRKITARSEPTPEEPEGEQP
ncbi:MAG: outer membrane protein assembly factor BamD [Planctomycetes bacterium]|nr:outer membrane protein assembly factor BamD [Planctomycetota bacterium]